MFQSKWPSWSLVEVMAYTGREDDEESGDEESDEEDEGPGDKTFDEKYVNQLRKENAARRTAAKEAEERAQIAETELKKLKEAEMSDIEKLKTQAEESSTKLTAAEERAIAAEADARNARLTLEVVKAASKIGFVDPADAQALMNLDEVEFDEETGRPDPKSITAQLKNIAKKKPYLLGEADPGDGDGSGDKKPPKPKSEFDKVTQKYQEQFEKAGAIPLPRG